MPNEFSFKLAFDDFDLDLLGDPAMDRNSELFGTKVSEFFAKQFRGFGGKARVLVNDSDREIEVRWTKAAEWQDPKETVLDLLNRRELEKALPMLWTLVQQDPTDTGNLYNLGVAYSELGQYSKAIEALEQLFQLDPTHVGGLTALGVAEIRSGNLNIGEEWLSKALQIQPDNRWALRNLGACLMKQGRFEEATHVLRRCLNEAPDDVNSMVGLAQALEELGQTAEAEHLYDAAIQMGGPEPVMELVRERRTKRAEEKLKSTSSFRPDAMHYILGAFEHFADMTPQEIQNLAFEIAMLGRKGLDINDPEEKHTLKSLEGEFSGLHLVSIMYAALKEFAPNENIGIDLSAEYEAALKARKGG